MKEGPGPGSGSPELSREAWKRGFFESCGSVHGFRMRGGWDEGFEKVAQEKGKGL